MGAIVSACTNDLGNPPIRSGESLLEFTGPIAFNPAQPASREATLLQYYLGSPFFDWSFRQAALVNDARTPSNGNGWTGPAEVTADPFDLAHLGLDQPFHAARYRSTHAFWVQTLAGPPSTEPNTQPPVRDFALQHEVVLSARDPQELFQTLVGLATRLTNTAGFPVLAWRNELTENRWPDAATLVYPPQAGWVTTNPPAPWQMDYSTFSFWRNGAIPEGPGAEPIDRTLKPPSRPGSVKAVSVINHGLCSRFIPYTDVLPTIAPRFFEAAEKGLLQGRYDDNQTLDAVLAVDDSDTTPFLRTLEDRDTKQQAGFFFTFDIRLGAIRSIPLHGSLNASLSVAQAFAFRLLDGRVTVDPLREVSFATTDSGLAPSDAVRAPIDDALLRSLDIVPLENASPNSIAGAVFQQSSQKQEFPGLIPGDGVLCTQRAPGDETIPVSNDPGSDPAECAKLFADINSNLKRALLPGSLATQLTGVDAAAFKQLWQSTALATMVNPHTNNPSDIVYKNFRCVTRDAKAAGEKVNACRYVVPARRLNPLPDGVEVVFVDDMKEYTNPSYIPWLILLNQTDPNTVKAIDQLCDPPRAQLLNVPFRRKVSTFHYDNHFLQAGEQFCTVTTTIDKKGDKHFDGQCRVQGL